MRLKKVTATDDVTLEGVDVEFEIVDDSVTRVTLTDAAGRVLIVTSDYGLSLLAPAPAEPVPLTGDANVSELIT